MATLLLIKALLLRMPWCHVQGDDEGEEGEEGEEGDEGEEIELTQEQMGKVRLPQSD